MVDTEFFKGDSLTLNIAVTDGSGAAVDLSGALSGKYGIFDGAGLPLVSKSLGDGISIAANVVTVTLLPADTASMLPGTYAHELEVIDSLAAVHTVYQGGIRVKRDYIVNEAP
jgi:hypothetical protein